MRQKDNSQGQSSHASSLPSFGVHRAALSLALLALTLFVYTSVPTTRLRALSEGENLILLTISLIPGSIGVSQWDQG